LISRGKKGSLDFSIFPGTKIPGRSSWVMELQDPSHHPFTCRSKARSVSIPEVSDSSAAVVRILVVEDFEPYRVFVTSLVAKHANMRVVGEVSSGLQAVEKAQELKPDLILMDIGLPDLNGIEAARRIRKSSPESKIIFLTQESSPELVLAAIGLGASGYVLKSLGEIDLLTAVETVIRGKQFVSGGVDGHGS